MALIKCPECGNEISDKAEKCPHCGNTVNKKTDILPKDIIECPECHKVLHSSTKICPYCGYSIKQGKKLNENIISQLKEKIPQIKKIYDKCKKEKRISIGIAAGIVAVAIFILIMLGNGKLGSQNYQKSVQSVSYEILSGASDAEDCGNLIKKVWYNSIYEESDTETDRFTKPDGYFVDDFDDALDNLFKDYTFGEKIKTIKDNQEKVKHSMKKLKNPPEKFQDEYNALKDFYDEYISFTNLVIDPQGSLKTFSENFNDGDTDVSNAYSSLEVYFDD